MDLVDACRDSIGTAPWENHHLLRDRKWAQLHAVGTT
jgi:hypothetical protein